MAKGTNCSATSLTGGTAPKPSFVRSTQNPPPPPSFFKVPPPPPQDAKPSSYSKPYSSAFRNIRMFPPPPSLSTHGAQVPPPPPSTHEAQGPAPAPMVARTPPPSTHHAQGPASVRVVDWTAIFDRVKESVFFVLLQPMQGKLEALDQVAERVQTVPPGDEEWHRVRSGYCSTGFVLMSGPTAHYVVTTAHSLNHLFNSSHPLESNTLDMIDASVLCHHFEQDYQQHGLPGERNYAKAHILVADCPKDILILVLPKMNLKNLVGDGTCARNHHSLVIADGVPREAKEAMLVSWPSHMHNKVSRDWTSSLRRISAISEPNPHGYNMSLLEVHMTTEKGSSGAPLVDEDGKVIGMLHGGFGAVHSYFVAANHLMGWVLPADSLK